MPSNKKIIEDFWSKVDCSASERNYYCFPPLRSRFCKLIFNESAADRRDWCEYWTVEKYLKDKIPFKTCLSICCGFGEIERILSRLKLAEEFVGTDIAPGAIAEAIKRANTEGFYNIRYYVSDMNSDPLPEDQYDIIWANGALHHIEELQRVIGKLQKSLKRGGYLITNEYVGPNYQQLPGRQQEIINAVKHILPADLRDSGVHLSSMERESVLGKTIGKLMGRRTDGDHENLFGPLWKMRSLEDFLRTDPSEGINSSKIIPLLNKFFDDVEVKYYHGSILQHALDSTFFKNFNLGDKRHREILDMLCFLEDVLIGVGEISSDNAHIICRKA